MSNVTGKEVKTLPEIRETLQEQVTSTVRWVDCLESLLGMGCDFFIELGPGQTLAGLLERTRKGIEVMSIGLPDSLRVCAERMMATA
jgi:[acyl-carrier-protein] S-malonyltransferase